MSQHVTIELLKGFLEAFNRHDLDSILDYFADDCVFYMPRGAKPRGDRYAGKKEVRAGLAKRFEGIPNVQYGDDQHPARKTVITKSCVRSEPNDWHDAQKGMLPCGG